MGASKWQGMICRKRQLEAISSIQLTTSPGFCT